MFHGLVFAVVPVADDEDMTDPSRSARSDRLLSDSCMYRVRDSRTHDQDLGS